MKLVILSNQLTNIVPNSIIKIRAAIFFLAPNTHTPLYNLFLFLETFSFSVQMHTLTSFRIWPTTTRIKCSPKLFRYALDLPSGGTLFWLFQTTNNLERLGTFETSVITRKRLSTRSYVKTIAVKPCDWGGINGRNSGLLTLLHF